MIGRWQNNNRIRGLSLVETMISMGILLVVGISTIGGIVFTRQCMELDKQRLAGINYLRQQIEAAETNSGTDGGTKLLTPFNEPGTPINCWVGVTYYPFNSDGSVNWSAPILFPVNTAPMLCKIEVTWTPPGSFGHRYTNPNPHIGTQSISMCTIVRAGTT